MIELDVKATDLESEAWFVISEFGDEAYEDAKDLFDESIKLGNDGAYSGLAEVVEDLTREQRYNYLSKAARFGRLDAIANIVNMVSETDDNENLYMWCYILENNSQSTFNMQATTKNLDEVLSSDQIAIATKKAEAFAKKVIEDGHKFSEGY
ncbi:hypothetical protein A3742_30160 [Oleiphilus sp. HI0071]|uniref:hypothetical protein n=1 Tax=unclassified Oleiphilus TaxID=2631174 RepID=UPI0007C25E36|nr:MULTISPECIES: hypothetical protein [unclassified Oleiphilus]KZY61711.1 hypothetical protein A3737_05690 [Oleiphilus sp. HI0065]KZY79271.1 hypothetical protein A3742_14545 [Oleiphilus sp. HI0071]KZY92504.1 hypothetical protein A3744_02005 [Oleiphilus sp. HI0073]KZZ43647.1 hypothetical protein A3758_15145 [Oleiphilus sp. HI0118]KZZ60993.1 hypothetical protein A3760_04615 [Oleiphilus sp. HI0122]KZZ71327.1 hypothetical protein A3765_14350 [Oleiphilus sp. HI0130]